MKIIVGLGNPGDKYAANRHNTGFMALDYFAAQNQLEDFNKAGKYKAETIEYTLGKEKALLIKPVAFMNLSGDIVQQATSYHKQSANDVLVIYDDLDLKFGII